MEPAPKHIALGVGLVLIVIGIGIVMAKSPPVVARSNAVPLEAALAEVSTAYEACQADEVLPSRTIAIRLSLEATFGPTVRVRVLHDGVTLTSGAQAAGWNRQSVTVPVRPLPRTVAGVRVCFAMSPKDETVRINGSTRGGPAGQAIRLEYMRPGHRTWWALAPSVARRMAFGRATNGVWIVLVVAAAMVALAAIVAMVAVRDPR
jgi:hypothetical protein